MGVGEHLRVAVRRGDGDTAVVALAGELDLASAPLLEGEVARAEVLAAARVVLDLSELRFIDSTGLRAILDAYSWARERGQEFAVTRGSEPVQRLLAITRIGEHIPVIDSPEQRASGT